MNYKLLQIKFCLVLLVMAMIFGISGVAEAWPTDEIIIIGGDENYPPYEYVDEDGVYRGFNVDIIKAVALQQGLEISFRPMPWSEAVIALANGEVHAIQGMTQTKIRQEKFLFSDPYVVNSQAIFVLKDRSYPISLADLKGRTVAVQEFDYAHDLLNAMEGVTLAVASDQEEAIDLLLEKKVDAFVGNRLTGMYLIQKHKKWDQIKIIGEKLEPTEYGLAVTKENEVLLELFNQGIAKIKDNGIYDEIYKKWFGEEVSPPNRLLEKILYGISILLLLVLAGTLVVFHWNRGLKIEVDKRTKELACLNEELLISKNTIAERERFKEQILDSLYVGLLTFDQSGRLTSINKKAAHLVKVERGFLGKHYSELPINELINTKLMQRALSSGDSYFDNEIKLKEFGEEATWEYNIFPLLDEEKQVNGLILNIKDVTHVKKLQSVLARQDKIESLGRLVAGIAHELRNPLTAIKTFVELIPVKLDNARFREELIHYVPMEIERLNNLVKDLLEYSKPRQPRKELVVLKPLIDDVINLFHKQLKDKGVELEAKVDPNLNIFVDKQQLKQIVINLVLNGLEASSAGGKITILGYLANDTKVRIIVRDSGTGIEDTDFDKLFDPFFTNKKDGTGLGLSIAYQYTKENQGAIWLESQLGRGTNVYLEFPKYDIKEVG
ncbi:MAG: transporter substrate-binding domain-containing protein [Bacillota bacterium]|nr:transporter substrate-binding domain-containing protein [Bacillota bacterium]